MTGKDSELKVVRQSRDGRRRYDEGGKRVLIGAALRPGASVARLAQEHGINANLLRKWIAKYLMEREKPFAPRRTCEPMSCAWLYVIHSLRLKRRSAPSSQS